MLFFLICFHYFCGESKTLNLLKNRILIVAAMLISCLSGIAQKGNGKQHKTVQKGKASYYSKRATGSRTASGERVHHDSLTCAHRTYPFGTLLKVRNLSNNKEVIVKVTDRGPFRRGRIIDMSYAAAKELGMLAQGIGTVEIKVYDPVEIPFRMPEYELPEMNFSVSEPEPPSSTLKLHKPIKTKSHIAKVNSNSEGKNIKQKK